MCNFNNSTKKPNRERSNIKEKTNHKSIFFNHFEADTQRQMMEITNRIDNVTKYKQRTINHIMDLDPTPIHIIFQFKLEKRVQENFRETYLAKEGREFDS